MCCLLRSRIAADGPGAPGGGLLRRTTVNLGAEVASKLDRVDPPPFATEAEAKIVCRGTAGTELKVGGCCGATTTDRRLCFCRCCCCRGGMTVSGLFLRITTAGLFFRKLVSKMEEREEREEPSSVARTRTDRPPVEGMPSSIARKKKKKKTGRA